MLRAAPKNRFGFCSALASTPPVSTLPEAGTHGVVGAGEAGDRVEQDPRPSSSRPALGLLDHHLGDLDVAAWPVRRRWATTSPLTVRDISVTSSGRSSISRRSDHVGMVGGDGVACAAAAPSCRSSAVRRAGPRWPAADRGDHVDDAAVMFSSPRMSRSRRRRLVGCSGVRFSNRILFWSFRRLEVDAIDLDQREVALAVFGVRIRLRWCRRYAG